MDPSSDRLESGVSAAAAAGLCLLTVLITVTGSTARYVWLDAVARALVVGIPIGVGLYARRHSLFPRFGTLLVSTGGLLFVTSLAGSDNELLYSVGRLAGWFLELALVFLVLAYPSGRLPARADRVIVAGLALTLLLLYVPTVFLVETFPVPSPVTTCAENCPGNAFMLTSSEPTWVEDVVRPLRELLTFGFFAAAVWRLGGRLRRSSSLSRLTLEPFLVVAIARGLLLVAALGGRAIDPDAPVVSLLALLVALAIPALALAFLLGILRWRLHMALSMQRLAAALRGHPRPEDLRDVLRRAFGDGTLEIAYWTGGNARWVDDDGHAVGDPWQQPDRAVTEVRDGDRRVAALVHDPALREDQSFVDSASSFALMTLDNHRLSAEATALLREVRGSRARIQQSADEERRRIERDLHDGAQQRLVALRIKLELAAERLDGNGAEMLRGLGDEVEEALDDVRSLARGIFPSPLADRGLVEALRAVALRTPIRTTVLATGLQERYPHEVESAAYFCCLEALQNAAKHAEGATAIVIELTDNGSLHFAVRDDGGGFDPDSVEPGMGMASMSDRVEAVGGHFDIESAPGRGTRVSAKIGLSG